MPNSSLATVDLLRQRFQHGKSDMAGAGVLESGVDRDAPAIAAAVLVPIVLRDTGLTMLLTQRTAHLRDHAGQVSFPGGRREITDASATDTALREANEEVGLNRQQIEIIGELPEYRTGTGFAIAPVVGLVHPPLNLKLDDYEVAEVFEPPLDFLLDERNHQRHSIEVRGSLRDYWAMTWRSYYIWGATAGILISLHRVLSRPT